MAENKSLTEDEMEVLLNEAWDLLEESGQVTTENAGPQERCNLEKFLEKYCTAEWNEIKEKARESMETALEHMRRQRSVILQAYNKNSTGLKEMLKSIGIMAAQARANKGARAGAKAGAKAAAKEGAKAGAKAVVKAGTKSVAKGGAKAGVKAGAKAGAKAAAKEGAKAGVKAGAKAGAKAAAKGGAKAGIKGGAKLAAMAGLKANPIGVVADVAQAGLEVAGYEKAAKPVGGAGNVIGGAIMGAVVGGPVGAAVGGAVAGGIWAATEIGAWGIGRLAGMVFGGGNENSQAEDKNSNELTQDSGTEQDPQDEVGRGSEPAEEDQNSTSNPDTARPRK